MQQERLKDHLSKRGACFTELMKHMGALTCLACDSQYAKKGITLDELVGDIYLKMEWGACLYVQSKCFEYISS